MSSVKLYRYDLTNGMAAAMSAQMLGMHLEGVWHTSVVLYGKEFYFDGGVGVDTAQPGTTRFGRPVRVDEFGATNKTEAEWLAWARQQNNGKYGPMEYSLLERNCNHFTDDAMKFLVGRGIGEDITTMIDRVLSTPMGAMFRPMLEQMSVRPGGPTGIPQDPVAAAQQAMRGGFPAPGQPSSTPTQAAPAQENQFLGHGVTEAAEATLSECVCALPEEGTTGPAAVPVLQRVIKNCLGNPTNPSYGKLNAKASAFASIDASPAAKRVLETLGFEPSGDHFKLAPAKASKEAFELVSMLLDSLSA